MNTNLTGPTGTDILIAVTDATAAHRAQGWHPEWSRHTIIGNLIDTMGDVDTTDPTCLTILANPTDALNLARNMDNADLTNPA